jgi:hypothetical protein
LIQSLSRRRQGVCGQKCVQRAEVRAKKTATPGSSPMVEALLHLQLETEAC